MWCYSGRGEFLAVVGMYFLCITKGFAIGKGDLLVCICSVVFSLHILVIDYFSPRTDSVKLSCVQFLINRYIFLSKYSRQALLSGIFFSVSFFYFSVFSFYFILPIFLFQPLYFVYLISYFLLTSNRYRGMMKLS